MKIRLARACRAGMVGLAVLVGVAAQAQAQAATIIKGRVVSEAGTPLPGTSVFIDATKAGAQTGEDGRYTITVAGSSRGPTVLNARRIGYRRATTNIVLNGTTITADFTLTAQAVQLTGMVVTALSVQREKSTIGTSQQALDISSLTQTRDANMVNTLSGKVSGVTIQGSGNMGGSSRIVIRGSGSISGNNQPLFIVDGVPVSNYGFSQATAYGGRDYGNAISDLNPDDIASITVLKGPNAAALYGSRAAAGAVVISTKSGRGTAEGVKVQFRSYVTADQFSVLPKYQNKYGQGAAGEFEYLDGQGGGLNDGVDASWGPRLDGQPIDQFTGPKMPWIAQPNNVKDFFQLGHTVSNNINVTANGAKAGARLSVTKDNTLGIVPNSSLSKLAAVVSASIAVNEKLTVSGSLQYVQNRGQNRPESGYLEGNPFMGFIWFGRQVDMSALKAKYFNADGSLFNWNANYHNNPYWMAEYSTALDTRDRIIAQSTVNYQVNSWLKGMVRLGQDGYRFSAEQHKPAGYNDALYPVPGYGGGFDASSNRATESNVEGLLTATKELSKFDLSLNAGGNIRRNNSANISYGSTGILVPGIYNLANAGVAPTMSATESHSGVNSVYGSGVMTWNKWATVEVTGRNDVSSTLPKETSSYFYPSVSGSLLLSDLIPAITKGGFISFAKLRGGYAQVGADASAYQLATTYTGSSSKFGGRPLFTLANTQNKPDLKPERTTGTEAGLEVSLLDDRITIDATYYSKQTKDQILSLPVSPTTGFSNVLINAGQMTNKGIEGLVTLRTLELKNGFQWRTTVNYTRNRNRVDALLPGVTTFVIATNWSANIEARVGLPYGTIFGDAWKRDSVTGKVMTSNGLPYKDPVRRVLGNVNPDWTGGLNNEFRYKNYTFSFLFDFRHGGQNFSSGNWMSMQTGVLESTLKGREEDWNKPGIVVDGIDASTGKPNTVNVTSEDYNYNLFYVNESGIFNTGFVKLREMRLGWDVPGATANRLHMSALNLAFVGRNLMMWTKFPNYDPENSSNSGNAGQGFDYGSLPSTRSFGLNIVITP